MDLAMELRHLEQADRHVSLGERHIAEQEDRIANLARLGADTTLAQSLLNSFYSLQVQHIEHRERILKTIKGLEPPRPTSLSAS